MRFAKKTDFIVLLILLALCFAGWLIYGRVYGGSPAAAEIYYRSELVKTVDLTEGRDYRFSLAQKPNVVFHVYADGSIRFEKSDCPDQICVRAGRLRTAGQSAACLPNKILLKIVARDKASADVPDIVVGQRSGDASR